MSAGGDLEFLALHGLAVKKAGTAATVAEVLGADPNAVAEALQASVAAGRAIEAKETFMATPAGRDWLDRALPRGVRRLPRRPRGDGRATSASSGSTASCWRLFTEWQMMPAGNERVPNDHSDPDYDHRIVDRLGAQHERAQRPLEQFAELEPRLGEYPRRLDAAYDKVLAGEHDFVSGAKVDSYHTVWFELHEDLLRMLGREREEQP